MRRQAGWLAWTVGRCCRAATTSAPLREVEQDLFDRALWPDAMDASVRASGLCLGR
jgi:hypothetical protein